MNVRRVQAWVWWLLPLLVARSLLPIGFMAQAHDGQLQVVFCSAALLLEQGSDSAGDLPVGTGGESCPFLHAAAAPPPAFHALPVVIAATDRVVVPDTTAAISVGPPRTDRARGPPPFS